MTAGVPVVFDVNVLVGAAAGGNSPFRSWPSPPPTSGNPFADSMGVTIDAEEFSLWLSPHLLRNTARVLATVFGWEATMVERFAMALVFAADRSGGGVVDPPRTVHDCKDHEDNLVLDLAAETGALLIVSEDADLTSMSPWRGTPVLRAAEFVSRVDVMRRNARRRR
ncbi:MAG TPA: PIN domain-containing protein [Micromonosporaceae bacterium]|nr:PIN domain-containing protein [Micromonosporaceae bacterium]